MEHEQDVGALYQRGLSVRQIAELTGIPKSTVAYRVRAAGLTRDRSAGQIAGCRRKTSVPFDWSFLPMTPGKAWLLGLVYGDGYLRPEGRAVLIRSRDREVVENVNALLGSGLRVTSHSYGWTIWINSARLCAELREVFGLVPGKSGERTFPRLGPAILSHFVRGLLDSDGVWMGSSPEARPPFRCVFTASSVAFVEGLRQAVDGGAGVIGAAHPISGSKETGAWSLSYTGADAIAVGRWLYRDSTPAIRCERMYEQWAARV
jgi:hypothetical protein